MRASPDGVGKAVVPLGRGMLQYGLAGLLEFLGTVEAPELQRSCCGHGKGDRKGTGTGGAQAVHIHRVLGELYTRPLIRGVTNSFVNHLLAHPSPRRGGLAQHNVCDCRP